MKILEVMLVSALASFAGIVTVDILSQRPCEKYFEGRECTKVYLPTKIADKINANYEGETQ